MLNFVGCGNSTISYTGNEGEGGRGEPDCNGVMEVEEGTGLKCAGGGDYGITITMWGGRSERGEGGQWN